MSAPDKTIMDGGVLLRSDRHWPDRVDDGQVPVQAHHDEGVDALVARDVDHILVDFAPVGPAGPGGHAYWYGREGHADDDEQQVGHGQVYDEEIGRVSHLPVGHHHNYYEQVAHEAQHGDDGENDGH